MILKHLPPKEICSTVFFQPFVAILLNVLLVHDSPTEILFLIEFYHVSSQFGLCQLPSVSLCFFFLCQKASEILYESCEWLYISFETWDSFGHGAPRIIWKPDLFNNYHPSVNLYKIFQSTSLSCCVNCSNIYFC